MSKAKNQKQQKTEKIDDSEVEIFQKDIQEYIRTGNIDGVKTSIIELAKDKDKINKIITNIDDLPYLNDVKNFNDLLRYLLSCMEIDIVQQNLGLSDLSKEVKKTLERTDIYQAYIFYIPNPQNRNIKIIPVERATPLQELTVMKELYLLHRPALYIDDKPIYVIVKNIPFSLDLKFISKENLESLLEVEIPSATEIHSLVNSEITLSIFGKMSLTWKKMLPFILLMIITHLIHYIITLFYIINL